MSQELLNEMKQPAEARNNSVITGKRPVLVCFSDGHWHVIENATSFDTRPEQVRSIHNRTYFISTMNELPIYYDGMWHAYSEVQFNVEELMEKPVTEIHDMLLQAIKKNNVVMLIYPNKDQLVIKHELGCYAFNGDQSRERATIFEWVASLELFRTEYFDGNYGDDLPTPSASQYMVHGLGRLTPAIGSCLDATTIVVNCLVTGKFDNECLMVTLDTVRAWQQKKKTEMQPKQS